MLSGSRRGSTCPRSCATYRARVPVDARVAQASGRRGQEVIERARRRATPDREDRLDALVVELLDATADRGVLVDEATRRELLKVEARRREAESAD